MFAVADFFARRFLRIKRTPVRCSGSVLLKSAFVLPPQLNTYRRAVLNIFTARGLAFQKCFFPNFSLFIGEGGVCAARRGLFWRSILFCASEAPLALSCHLRGVSLRKPRCFCGHFTPPTHTRTHGHSLRIEMPVKKARSYFAGRRRREYYYIIDMGSESITSSISSSNSNSRFSSSTALTTAVTDDVK